MDSNRRPKANRSGWCCHETRKTSSANADGFCHEHHNLKNADTAMKQLISDTMPSETALEHPTKDKRITNSFRKTCQRARATYWTSEQSPKAPQDKLSNRMSRLPIDRLIRAKKRNERRLRHAKNSVNRITVDFIRNALIQEVVVPLIISSEAIGIEINQRELQVKNHEPSEPIHPNLRRKYRAIAEQNKAI
jgi:hypothetical protein